MSLKQRIHTLNAEMQNHESAMQESFQRESSNAAREIADSIIKQIESDIKKNSSNIIRKDCFFWTMNRIYGSKYFSVRGDISAEHYGTSLRHGNVRNKGDGVALASRVLACLHAEGISGRIDSTSESSYVILTYEFKWKS